ncbi:hypothetical protein EGY19_19335 [Burkholderia multivorans]|uniref:Uncharacterized protein n=1 Tax=Burkholderia multivorans TaxID=87883 RepID=A0A2S9MAX3_9BURK|nr:hypothetical protein EGY19_19335 [Burkholderia multivorans]OXH89928.1 hypothetical protein CA831_12135 [Burkholderia multivorans]PRE02555.1 hypothetical protein C6P91_21190 [Burkholderia multivorans]PRE76869.1 hypothetical protein C6Q02_22700 [Burkholderia multivorans]PRF01212.1 hypothetical protein C6Q07_23185 [Burkholderia multivorans]
MPAWPAAHDIFDARPFRHRPVPRTRSRADRQPIAPPCVPAARHPPARPARRMPVCRWPSFSQFDALEFCSTLSDVQQHWRHT